eukprot:g1575.t1
MDGACGVNWSAFHSSYDEKIDGCAITAGCGDWCWATGEGALPEHGKYRIEYEVKSIDTDNIAEIRVGVASRGANVHQQETWEPEGCYFWLSYRNGDGSYLVADGRYAQEKLSQESCEGSKIEVVVDQDASTVEFRLDGEPVVDEGGTACKLSVKPEHKRDLTPAACVYWAPSAVTLVTVEPIRPIMRKVSNAERREARRMQENQRLATANEMRKMSEAQRLQITAENRDKRLKPSALRDEPLCPELRLKDCITNTPVLNATVTVAQVDESGHDIVPGTERKLETGPGGTVDMRQLSGLPDGVTHRVVIDGGEHTNPDAFLVTPPVLASGTTNRLVEKRPDHWRVVLKWDDVPKDLDAHLIWKRSDGPAEHVYYSEKKSAGGDADLDIDVTDGKGPETITFRARACDANPDGTPVQYHFYVHNYSGDPSMKVKSRAQVSLYDSQGTTNIYSIEDARGDDASHRYWSVFKLSSNGELVVTNELRKDEPNLAE